MIVSIDIEDDAWRTVHDLEQRATAAVGYCLRTVGRESADDEIAVLFTGNDAIADLNRRYRGRDGPTNVLSFPAAAQAGMAQGMPRPLGDIVVAYGVTAREAREQGKSLIAHTTHLLIHGTLHLLGHDHHDNAEAERMEALEREIMNGLGFADPYHVVAPAGAPL